MIWILGYTANGFDVAIGVALGLGFAVAIRALSDAIRYVSGGYIPSGPTWTEQDDRLYEIVNRRIRECTENASTEDDGRSEGPEESGRTKPGPSVRVLVTEKRQVAARGVK